LAEWVQSSWEEMRAKRGVATTDFQWLRNHENFDDWSTTLTKLDSCYKESTPVFKKMISSYAVAPFYTDTGKPDNTKMCLYWIDQTASVKRLEVNVEKNGKTQELEFVGKDKDGKKIASGTTVNLFIKDCQKQCGFTDAKIRPFLGDILSMPTVKSLLDCETVIPELAEKLERLQKQGARLPESLRGAYTLIPDKTNPRFAEFLIVDKNGLIHKQFVAVYFMVDGTDPHIVACDSREEKIAQVKGRNQHEFFAECARKYGVEYLFSASHSPDTIRSMERAPEFSQIQKLPSYITDAGSIKRVEEWRLQGMRAGSIRSKYFFAPGETAQSMRLYLVDNKGQIQRRDIQLQGAGDKYETPQASIIAVNSKTNTYDLHGTDINGFLKQLHEKFGIESAMRVEDISDIYVKRNQPNMVRLRENLTKAGVVVSAAEAELQPAEMIALWKKLPIKEVKHFIAKEITRVDSWYTVVDAGSWFVLKTYDPEQTANRGQMMHAEEATVMIEDHKIVLKGKMAGYGDINKTFTNVKELTDFLASSSVVPGWTKKAMYSLQAVRAQCEGTK
ncbi:MAG TPA: hypothetical protein VN457_08310, partial [Chlamydiales bacterium]|nr:hypothetical protein [Chlamydiales bacterium]